MMDFTIGFQVLLRSGSGCISSWILKDIYDRIEDLNREWNNIINKKNLMRKQLEFW